MKEITIRIYEYDELSDKAKRKAYEDWLSMNHEHFRDGEVLASLKRIEEEFGIEVTRWSYGACSYDCGTVRFENWNDDQLALAGERARAFLWNNFGHLVMQPRTHYYMKVDGKWRNCVGQESRKYESKVFFDRTYDGTCPLTGVCFDNDALDPLACFCFGVKWDEKAKKRVMVPHDERWRWKSKTVEDVIRECVDALFESAQKDCEYQDSEEHFAEMCSANDWTFEEDGTIMDAA